MRVGKLGHASLVVSEGRVTCLMDPVFIDPFEGGANRMDPPVEWDVEGAARACDLVVLSHAHMDHFCVRSLDHLRRDVPVLYPSGEALIAHALEQLGFSRAQPVSPGERVSVGDLALYPTASRAGFPEMGMLFQGKRSSFWNMVDSVADDQVVDAVRALVGRPDLVFAKFQPLVENELIVNALGSDFPVAKYSALLRNVWNVRPRCAAPSSCGYRYARAPWLNDRGFPVTDAQFGRDVTAGDPSIKVLTVPHGGAVEVDAPDMHVEPDGVPFVRRVGARLVPSFDWRPERGVPALADDNAGGDAPDALRKRVADWLDRELIGHLKQQPVAWLERMARHAVDWRLEVVYPVGPADVRALDFSDLGRGWGPPTPETFYKLHTSIAASAIAGLLDGTKNAYSLTFNDIRVMERLYSVTRDGASRFGSLEDEPMMRVLCDGADERFVERQLTQLRVEREARSTGGGSQ